MTYSRSKRKLSGAIPPNWHDRNRLVGREWSFQIPVEALAGYVTARFALGGMR